MPLGDLIGNLIHARSGRGGLGQASDLKADKKRSLDELVRLADKRLKDAGDRGWGALCATLDDAALTWLAVGEDSHPSHMRQWPEQTVRAMTVIMQLQGEHAWFSDVVNAFETLWFMTAYRRKRRPLTHNPMSLISKDPYIVASRLERGEFLHD